MENNERKQAVTVTLTIKKRAYITKDGERRQALDYTYHCPVSNRDIKLTPVFKSDASVNYVLLGMLLADDDSASKKMSSTKTSTDDDLPF